MRGRNLDCHVTEPCVTRVSTFSTEWKGQQRALALLNLCLSFLLTSHGTGVNMLTRTLLPAWFNNSKAPYQPKSAHSWTATETADYTAEVITATGEGDKALLICSMHLLSYSFALLHGQMFLTYLQK